ncbi:hypothetical protein OROHE_000162 [Orobanche hederae]
MCEKVVMGFVGLDEVSLELAASLVRSGYAVQAFETSSVNALVTLVSHVDQIEDLFYGDEGALKGFLKDVIIIVHSTILPAHIQNMEKVFTEYYQMEVVDMYVLKGVSETSNGRLMIVSSGQLESLARAQPFLSAFLFYHSAMSGKLFLFEGDLGAGSKCKMGIELLEGIHFVASLEAMSLGAQAGIHPWIIYDIISNAAGSSRVFRNYIPHLLRGNQSTHHMLSAFNKIAGIVLDMAKSQIFPLPLLSVAHQQILAGSHGVKDDDVDTSLLKVWEKLTGVKILEAANAKSYNLEELASQLSTKSETVKRVGFIGLGAMGFGMTIHLRKSNFSVLGYDGMLENRGPHMVDNDYTPLSALDIFVKDLGIVSRECSSLRVPLHVSNVADQLFLSGSAAGWGRIDDSAVVKWKPHTLSKESVLHSLPSEWPADPIEDIINLTHKNLKTVVVLDDDPTGTQTVHDIYVLTEWTIESLVELFSQNPKCFFILTNSQSLSSEKARALVTEICSNLSAAANIVGNTDYTVVLSGDSTLRGHFPEEADAAISVIGEVDVWIISPFLSTRRPLHYWRLVPAGETEFAKDASFGYKSSNLREWMEEKTGGRIPAGSVSSISIQLLRKGGPGAVCEPLCSLKRVNTLEHN